MMTRAEKVKANAVALRKMADVVKPLCMPAHGFIIMTFDFGHGGEIGYVSNGQRADVIKTLEEFLGNMKRDGSGQ